MPVTIVATAGSATANSFATEAQFASYMHSRLNAGAYDAADTDERKRALVEATRDLDLVSWDGTRTDDTQALSWPRQYAVDPDAPSPVDPADPQWPVYFDDDAVPQRIIDGTCELAFQYLVAGTTDLATYDTSLDLKRKKTDVLEREYFEPHRRTQGMRRFTRLMLLIGPLMDEARAGGLDVVRV